MDCLNYFKKYGKIICSHTETILTSINQDTIKLFLLVMIPFLVNDYEFESTCLCVRPLGFPF